MDKRPIQEGTTIDLLQDTSAMGGAIPYHVTAPEVRRNRSDGKSRAGSQGNNDGNGGSYRSSIDVQIRRATTSKDLANSSLTSMTYCRRCCKGQQIYDRCIATSTNSDNLTFLDASDPLGLKNFDVCSLPYLFPTSRSRPHASDRSTNLSFGGKNSHHQTRLRSPSIRSKKAINNESSLDPPRQCFNVPPANSQDAGAKYALGHSLPEGPYKIHSNHLPAPSLLSTSAHRKGAKKNKRGWKRSVCSCREGAKEDPGDSSSGFYKSVSTALETSEDDLLTISGGKEVRRRRKTQERCVDCVRIRTCGRLVLLSLLMILILVTVVGLLPSLVFWVLSTQQDKQPALLTREGEVTSTGGESTNDASHVTSSLPITRGSPELPLIDSDGWSSHKQSKYKTIDKPMSFYNAQEFCQKLGGHLVHINSLREQVFVEDYIIQLLRIQNLSTWDDGIGFWIGARRDRGSHEGTCMFNQWKWVDPYGRALGVVTGFAAFIPGKPDKLVSL